MKFRTLVLPAKRIVEKCIILEVSPKHFKCNENVSERRKPGMKPDEI